MNRFQKLAWIILLALVFSAKSMALSPPWVVLQNQMKATIGADPLVRVDDLDEVSQSPEKFNLDVHVKCDCEKAQALADFIGKEHDFGGVLVDVRVFDERDHLKTAKPIPTHPDEAEELVKDALRTNRYFVKIDPKAFLSDFFIEFCKGVVQYQADNIADFYRNINQVAADAFAQILGLDDIPGIHIGVTTSEKKVCCHCDKGLEIN